MPPKTVSVDVDLTVRLVGAQIDKAVSDLSEIVKGGFKDLGETLSVKPPPGSVGNPTKDQIGRLKELNSLVRQFIRYGVGYAVLYQFLGAVSALTRGLLDLNEALFDIKAVSAATTAQMDQMEGAIKRVATTTKFTITEIAQAGKVLAQTGLRGEDFASALDATARFASAVGASIDLAADLVSTMRQVFNEMTDTSIANLLTKAVNISKLTAADLKTILSLSTQTAKQYGLSAEQLVAGAATLRNAGIKASTVATGFRQALIELFSLDNTATKVITNRYREIGEAISEEMVRARFFSFTQQNNPLIAVLTELQRLGFSGGARQQFARAFDVRAVNAILPLIDRLGELRKSEVDLAFGNAALDASATQMDSFNNSAKNLGATLTSFTDDLLDGLIPALTMFNKWITSAVKGLQEWNQEMKEATGAGLDVALTGGAAGAVTGGLLGKGAAGRLAGAVGGFAVGSYGGLAGAPKAAELGVDDEGLQRLIGAIGGIVTSIVFIGGLIKIFGKFKVEEVVEEAEKAKKNVGKLKKGAAFFFKWARRLLKGGGILGVLITIYDLFSDASSIFASDQGETLVSRLNAQKNRLQKLIAETNDQVKALGAYDLGGDTSTGGGQVALIQRKLGEARAATQALFGQDSVSSDTLRLMEVLSSMGAEANSEAQKRLLKQMEKAEGKVARGDAKSIARNINAIVEAEQQAVAAVDAALKDIRKAQTTAESSRSTAQRQLVESYDALQRTQPEVIAALSDTTLSAQEHLDAVAQIYRGVTAATDSLRMELEEEGRKRVRNMMETFRKKVLTDQGTLTLTAKELAEQGENLVSAMVSIGHPLSEALKAWDRVLRLIQLRAQAGSDEARKQEKIVLSGKLSGPFAFPVPSSFRAQSPEGREATQLREATVAGEQAIEAERLRTNQQIQRQEQREIINASIKRIRLNELATKQYAVVQSDAFKNFVREAFGEKVLNDALSTLKESLVVDEGDTNVVSLSKAYKDNQVLVDSYNEAQKALIDKMGERARSFEKEKRISLSLSEAQRALEAIRREEGGLGRDLSKSVAAINDVYTQRLARITEEEAFYREELKKVKGFKKEEEKIGLKLLALQDKRLSLAAEQESAITAAIKAARRYAETQAKQTRDVLLRQSEAEAFRREAEFAAGSAGQRARGAALSTQQQGQALRNQRGAAISRRGLLEATARDTRLKPEDREKAQRDAEALTVTITNLSAEIDQLNVSFQDALAQGFEIDDIINQLNDTEAATKNLGATIRSDLVGGFMSVGDAIADMVFEGKDALESLGNTAKRIASDILATIIKNRLITLLGSLGTVNPGTFVGVSGGNGTYPRNFEFTRSAGGGIVSGPGTGTSDSIPARLGAGEGVLTARAVLDLGRNFVHAANRGVFAATGGVMFDPSKKGGKRNPFAPVVNVSVQEAPGTTTSVETAQSSRGLTVSLIAKQVEGRLADRVGRGEGSLNRALEGLGVNRAASLVR